MLRFLRSKENKQLLKFNEDRAIDMSSQSDSNQKVNHHEDGFLSDSSDNDILQNYSETEKQNISMME
jgi:hypothetical protein